MKFGTKAIHFGIEPDPTTGAIMTPIFQTSTFVQHSPGKPYVDKNGQIYEYSRSHNPTRITLERNLASLEVVNMKPEEVGALCFSSGLGATDAIMKLLRPGDHVIKGDDLYGGSHRIFDKVYAKNGIGFTPVDMGDLDMLKSALKQNTKMIWLETPTNPMLKLSDIELIGRVIKEFNSSILYVVDNTFCSPYLQNPLELGADIVIHSATKYIGGHSDLVMGAIMCNKSSSVPYNDDNDSYPIYLSNGIRDLSIYSQLKWLQNAVGAVPGILDCFLALRGIKTLHLRMQQHCLNASAICKILLENSAVEEVFYPGLTSHRNHEVAKKQMKDYGGMVSLRLKNDTLNEASIFMQALNDSPNQTFKIAESLGGVESLANHPSSMTHGAMPEEDRIKLGITPGLVRLSVGIEDTNDLIEDMTTALSKCSKSKSHFMK